MKTGGTSLTIDLSMSLDGFIAGPNEGPGNVFDDGGERLHHWMFNGTSPSRFNEFFKPVDGSHEIVDEWFETTGALVVGRRWFDIVEGWGGTHPFGVPFFVLTHDAPETDASEDTMGSFVTDGIESALEQASAAAGDKNVIVGGANVAQQYLRAGLLDEIQIHLVPNLLGDGVRLFENLDGEKFQLEQTRVIESTGVTHLQFHVVSGRESK